MIPSSSLPIYSIPTMLLNDFLFSSPPRPISFQLPTYRDPRRVHLSSSSSGDSLRMPINVVGRNEQKDDEGTAGKSVPRCRCVPEE